MKLIATAVAALATGALSAPTESCATGQVYGVKPDLTYSEGDKYCKASIAGKRGCYDDTDTFVEALGGKGGTCANGGKWRSAYVDGACEPRACHEEGTSDDGDSSSSDPKPVKCGDGERRGWTYTYSESHGRCKPNRSIEQWEKICVPKCGDDFHLASAHIETVCQAPICVPTKGTVNTGQTTDCASGERLGPSIYEPRGKGTYCKAMDKGSNTACVPKCGSAMKLRSKETCDAANVCTCAAPACV